MLADGGQRIEKLKRTVEEISSIYDLASPTGIKSVRFLNRKVGFKNVRNKKWGSIFNQVGYDGVARVGESLRAKVMDKFVWNTQMAKPLLVMVITAGVVRSCKTPDSVNPVLTRAS